MFKKYFKIYLYLIFRISPKTWKPIATAKATSNTIWTPPLSYSEMDFQNLTSPSFVRPAWNSKRSAALTISFAETTPAFRITHQCTIRCNTWKSKSHNLPPNDRRELSVLLIMVLDYSTGFFIRLPSVCLAYRRPQLPHRPPRRPPRRWQTVNTRPAPVITLPSNTIHRTWTSIYCKYRKLLPSTPTARSSTRKRARPAPAPPPVTRAQRLTEPKMHHHQLIKNR